MTVNRQIFFRLEGTIPDKSENIFAIVSLSKSNQSESEQFLLAIDRHGRVAGLGIRIN